MRYACVLTDGESAGGRCGIGAVMGAKRLKAVVVRGSRDVGIADPKRFKAALDSYRETLEGEGLDGDLAPAGNP